MALFTLGSAFPKSAAMGGRVLAESTQARLLFQAKVKGQFFSSPKIKRMMDDMTYRSLYNAGYAVKQAAKKGIGNSPPKQTKAGMRAIKAGQIVEYDGGLYKDLTMLGSARPRVPGKPIKSHNPKRFVYYDIKDWLVRGGPVGWTVVIGPYKAPWLNQLHEFGGTLTLTAYRIGANAARNAYLRKRGYGRQGRDERGRFTTAMPNRNQFDYGAILWSNKRMRNSKRWERTNLTKQARYPARPFMQGAAGVQKAAAKANEKFRNMLRRAG